MRYVRAVATSPEARAKVSFTESMTRVSRQKYSATYAVDLESNRETFYDVPSSLKHLFTAIAHRDSTGFEDRKDVFLDPGPVNSAPSIPLGSMQAVANAVVEGDYWIRDFCQVVMILVVVATFDFRTYIKIRPTLYVHAHWNRRIDDAGVEITTGRACPRISTFH